MVGPTRTWSISRGPITSRRRIARRSVVNCRVDDDILERWRGCRHPVSIEEREIERG